MGKISKDLDEEVRKSSKNHCGYCLSPQNLASHKLEIEHIYPISKAEFPKKKISVWRAGIAIYIKPRKFTASTQFRQSAYVCLIQIGKFGRSISFGVKIKHQLSVKLLADAQRFSP